MHLRTTIAERPSEGHCPGGGIGRRAGFRYLWPRGRGSSSLLLGTITIHGNETGDSADCEGGVVNLRDVHIQLHTGDLPAGVSIGESVAVDTETTGLNPHRDRLCLVQLSGGDGVCHLVHFPPEPGAGGACAAYAAPNLKAVLADERILKLFHFARFDVAMLYRWLGVICAPVYCTKIASKLVRTYTDRHGLRDLCRELLR